MEEIYILNVLQYLLGYFEIYMCFEILRKVYKKENTKIKQCFEILICISLAVIEAINRSFRLYSILLIAVVIIVISITFSLIYSTSDLIYNNVPFVTIPIGADQRYIASRVSELGATICLNKDNISPQLLSDSMKRVITERKYREAVEKISISFKDAGGYKKALMEISKFKILHSIE